MFGFLTRAELGDVDVDEPSTNEPVTRFNFNLNVRIGNWFRWLRSKRRELPYFHSNSIVRI